MRYIQFLLAAGLLLLSGCEKLNSKKHYVLDAGFQTYFNFNNGSEWNYTEMGDSTDKEKVVVSGFLKGKMVWDAFDQEFLQYDLVSDRDSIYKLRSIADENNVARASLLVRDTAFKQAAEWYYVAGQFVGSSGSGDSFIYHASYSQGGKVYQDVIELKPKMSAYFKRIYMSRNVGIIRKELTSGKVYLLKSYLVQ